MKTEQFTNLCRAVVFCGLVLSLAWAAPTVSASTYGATGSTLNLEQLYLSGTPDVAAPIGYRVWFVGDTNNDGVPTAPTADAILSSDDVQLHADVVDGLSFGDQPGKYHNASITVDTIYETANIWVYIWDVLSPAAAGQAGQTFGLLDLGVIPAPALGNAEWTIGQAVYADTYTVLEGATAAVPEPSTVMLVLGGALVAWATVRNARDQPVIPMRF